MRAASQLSGRGPTGVDVAPVLASCMLIKNLIMIILFSKVLDQTIYIWAGCCGFLLFAFTLKTTLLMS